MRAGRLMASTDPSKSWLNTCSSSIWNKEHTCLVLSPLRLTRTINPTMPVKATSWPAVGVQNTSNRPFHRRDVCTTSSSTTSPDLFIGRLLHPPFVFSASKRLSASNFHWLKTGEVIEAQYLQEVTEADTAEAHDLKRKREDQSWSSQQLRRRGIGEEDEGNTGSSLSTVIDISLSDDDMECKPKRAKMDVHSARYKAPAFRRVPGVEASKGWTEAQEKALWTAQV